MISINEKGMFTAGQKQDSGYVYVIRGGIRDSARIYITRVASIELLPDPMILKVGESQTITPTARDEYNNVITLAASDYQWLLPAKSDSFQMKEYLQQFSRGRDR